MILTLPTAPHETVAQLVYVNGAREPAYAFIPRRTSTGMSLEPLRLTGRQWRLVQLLQRSGSRFV
jgi:hypothetical protein